MKVKICGITNLQDALFCLKAGAWALGFNFYRHSPRYLPQEKAKEIIKNIPDTALKVGIFVDHRLEDILSMMDNLKLDLAQVYQDYPAPISIKQKMIRCFQPTANYLFSDDDLNHYEYILIDAPRLPGGLFGGTGICAHWDIACQLSKDHRLILAGGLHADNVQAAINEVNPFAVDITTYTESKVGIKNPILVTQFIQKAQYES